MKSRFFLIAGVMIAVTLLSPPSQAQDAWSFDSIGAAISFKSYQTDFNVGAGTYNTTVDELGLSFRQYFGHDFSLAMEGGYATLSMDSNPAQLNLSPSGYYGRITARYQWWLTGNFGFDFIGAGAYHRVHDESGTDNVVDRWWSYSVAAGPRYQLRWFNVGAGVIYHHASGDEEGSLIAGDRSLQFASPTNAYLDFDFTLTPHGTFGLHFEMGARQSAALVFGYRFVSP